MGWKLLLVGILGVSTQVFAGGNVFTPDEREEVTSNKSPWAAVGYLMRPNGAGCTATLVGRNVIATAAHCVLKPNKYEHVADTKFFPNLVRDNTNHSSTVTTCWAGSHDGQNTSIEDWAICRLEHNLGDVYGWMGATLSYYSTANLAGYSGDFAGGKTAGVHRNCKINGVGTGGMYEHFCDMTRGASGGPIFVMIDDKPYVFAINSGEKQNGERHPTSLIVDREDSRYAGLAVPSSKWMASLKQALAK